MIPITPTDIIPVIILDCNFRSQSGIIQTFGRKGIPIIALSGTADCPAFHSKYVTQAITSPILDNGEELFIDFLLNLPQKGVLIYSNDPCAVTIAKYQQQLRDSGYLLSMPDSISLEQTFDKWECYKLATSLKIPMPRTLLVESIEDIHNAWETFNKPVILKGTTLAGGMYHKLSHRTEIAACWEKIIKTVTNQAYATRKSRIILQEWHQYPMTDNWSCETIYSPDSQAAGFFTIQRTRCSLNDDGTYSSRLFAGHYASCPELEEKTQKILSEMHWQGFAHVEYFYVPDQQTFMLTEVNPRLPGYSYYPSSAGFDLAYYYYAYLTGTPFAEPTSFPPSLYFETFHYPGDFTSGIRHILKRNINLLPFLTSYFKLLLPGSKKIIDPIRPDDLNFSLHTQIEAAKKFTKKCWGYLRRKIGIVYST